MPTNTESLQALTAAGLLPAGASSDLQARLQSLSAIEVQALLATRARVGQDQVKSDHGFLMV